MLLKNKKMLLLSSVLILLPIPVGMLLRDRFPVEFVQSFLYWIFLPPVSLLAGQWLCIWLSVKLDATNQEKNRKPMSVVLWIMPLLSNLLAGIMYALMLGLQFSPFSYMACVFGIMFAVIGNYMPKTRMNSTMGIKIKWTYTSDANWNATHRFAGKLWCAGGVLLLIAIFLPEWAAIALMTVDLLVITLLPTWYSWRFYCREKEAGKKLNSGYPAVSKKAVKFSGVFLTLILVFVVAIMFVGDLTYTMGEESFTIEADWYSDLTVSYDSIQSMELREGNVPGERVGGFGSLRLLMGYFRNDEFGNHIRYSYYKPDACVILTTENQTLVLSGETREATLKLYETLKEKIN